MGSIHYPQKNAFNPFKITCHVGMTQDFVLMMIFLMYFYVICFTMVSRTLTMTRSNEFNLFRFKYADGYRISVKWFYDMNN